MRLSEIIEKPDLDLLKAEWALLQTTDPDGVPLMAAKGPAKYNPANTARITGMPNYQNYPTVTNTKPEIKAMVSDPKNSSLKLLFYILAWGGVINRARNPQLLYKRLKNDKNARVQVIKTLNKIREGNISNAEAFDLFQSLRKNDLLPGLGVSYFTKVLYFLRPGKHSFILDQFTAKAMNYLHSKDPQNYPQIPMDNDMPSNKLTGMDYEKYIRGVEQVAKDVRKSMGKISPEEAEFLIFGAHGKKFRDAAQNYHNSRTDLKQPKDNKFRYIYKNQQKQQQAQQQVQQTELQQSQGKAQEIWNNYMTSVNQVSTKFKQLPSDEKLDFQQEFIDDVAQGLRNNEDIGKIILNVIKNYSI